MKAYPHLLIDGIYHRRLTAAELREWMPYLAREIGLTPYGETQIAFEIPVHPWGISSYEFVMGAIQPVAESHLALEYMRPPHFSFDVFACVEIDRALVKRILLEHFQIKEITWADVIRRGPEMAERAV